MAHGNRLTRLMIIALLLTLMASACVTPEPRLVDVSQAITQTETVVEMVYETVGETALASATTPLE